MIILLIAGETYYPIIDADQWTNKRANAPIMVAAYRFKPQPIPME